MLDTCERQGKKQAKDMFILESKFVFHSSVGKS